MAKSRLLFRFVLNRTGKGGAEAGRRAREATNAVLQNIIGSYATGTYEEVRKQIVSRLDRDINTELSFMAGQFKRSVIGIAGSAPTSMLAMANPMAQASKGIIPPSAQASAGISWAQRGDRYMDWKKANGYGNKWFKNEGSVISGYLGSRENWQKSFGPTQIRIERGKKGASSGGSFGRMSSRERNESKGGRITYMGAANSTFKQLLMTVRVAALTDITPAMLPGLRTGQMGGYPKNGRKTGLMGKLPGDVAYRLGGQKKAPYRHTVEPFLTFVLTRAIPNALFLRVEKGLQATSLQMGTLKRR